MIQESQLDFLNGSPNWGLYSSLQFFAPIGGVETTEATSIPAIGIILKHWSNDHGAKPGAGDRRKSSVLVVDFVFVVNGDCCPKPFNRMH